MFSLKSVAKQITEFLIDIIFILFYIIRSVILLFIPNKFLLKSVLNSKILITGGGSGIGRALAVGFASRGAIIVIWDVNKAGLEETVHLVESVKGTIFSYLCDVTDKEKVYETAVKVGQDVGVIDILINNAGIVNGKSFLQISDEKIVETFNVNVISHFWLIKAFLPDMLKRNSGHLVSVASVAGLVGVSGLTDYCASKFAAIGLEESIVMELKRDGYNGIKSTIVCPYYINTGLFEGVNCTLLSMLETNYVSEKIIAAVLKDQSVIVLPKILYGLMIMKSILPNDAFDRLYQIFGGNKLMNHFKGRQNIRCDSNQNISEYRT